MFEDLPKDVQRYFLRYTEAKVINSWRLLSREKYLLIHEQKYRRETKRRLLTVIVEEDREIVLDDSLLYVYHVLPNGWRHGLYMEMDDIWDFVTIRHYRNGKIYGWEEVWAMSGEGCGGFFCNLTYYLNGEPEHELKWILANSKWILFFNETISSRPQENTPGLQQQ